MSNSRWDPHRSEIERLFLCEKKTLPEVMAVLAASRNFRASKPQYERMLTKWGIRKNRKKHEWKAVERQLARRKDIFGKESEVFIDGVECSPSRLRKRLARHGPLSTVDRLWPSTTEDAPSPQASSGIVVCSPHSTSLQIEWDEDFPWLRFLKSIQPLGYQVSSLGPSPQIDLASLFSAGTRTLRWSSRDLMSGLGSMLRCNSTRMLRTVQSGPRVTAVLSTIMPESRPGEHQEIARRLCDSDCSSGQTEIILMHLFLLANDFTVQSDTDTTIQKQIEIIDSRTVDLLRGLGSSATKILKRMLSGPDATTAAIHEKLFASVLRSQHLGLLKVILETGINTNILIDTVTGVEDLRPHHGALDFWFEDDPRFISPLEYAASLSDETVSLEMARLLLSYGAEVNRNGPGLSDLHLHRKKASALYLATRKGYKELMALLLEAGARPLPSSLEFAVANEDIALLRMILDAGANDNARFSNIEYCHYGLTPLGLAARNGSVETAQTLLDYGANIDGLQWISYYISNGRLHTTALGCAAHEGRLEMTRFLLKRNAKVNPSMAWELSPLFIACSEGNHEIALALLSARADVSRADENAAVTRKFGTLLGNIINPLKNEFNLQLYESAIARGACVSGDALLQAIHTNNHRLVVTLSAQGASMDAPGELSRNPLEVAIEEGRVEIALSLLSAGAEAASKIRRIDSVEMAHSLQRFGQLDAILRGSGPTVLSHAILAEDQKLVQLLLTYNIDVSQELWLSLQSCIPTPLDAAVSRGAISLTQALIERGAPITDSTLNSAIWETLATGDENVLTFLLHTLQHAGSRSPVLKFASCTSLKIAMWQRNCRIVRLLLDNGVDPRGDSVITEPLGQKPMHEKKGHWWISKRRETESVPEMAARLGDPYILQTILESAQWEENDLGHALAMAIDHDHFQLAQDLMDAGACLDPSGPGEIGLVSPLEAAVSRQHIPLVQTLLRAGAKVNSEKYEHTALQRAVDLGHSKLVNLLMEAGADVNSPAARHSRGATALQEASMRGYLGIARTLLDAGADVNARAGYRLHGRTALEGAAENGRIDMLHLLLSRGANLRGRGRRQYARAVQLAESHGHNAAANLIKSYHTQTASDDPEDEDDSDDLEDENDSDDYPGVDQGMTDTREEDEIRNGTEPLGREDSMDLDPFSGFNETMVSVEDYQPLAGTDIWGQDPWDIGLFQDFDMGLEGGIWGWDI